MTEAPTRQPNGAAGAAGTHAALPAVEQAISSALAGLPERIRRACERLSGAGGRRLRGHLVLLAAGVDRPDAECEGAGRERAVAAAAAVELLHLASLLHDDLLDGARTRRGVPTANASEGDALALLAGNCVMAVAFGCASRLGPGAVELAQNAVLDLCEGAALEQHRRYRTDLDAREVIEVARLKAGTLFALACRLGAAASGDDDAVVERALGEYGSHLGIALQLLDDLLDVTSTEPVLGKPVEADFPNGVVTLPALPALEGDAVLRELARSGLSQHERRYVTMSIRRHAGPDITLRAAEDHVSRARSIASSAALRDHPSAAALASLPEQLLRTQVSLVDPAVRPFADRGA